MQHASHVPSIGVIFCPIKSLHKSSTYITSAVKSVVETAIGDINQMVLDALAIRESGGVYKFGCAELACPRLLARVRVDRNDARRANESRCRDDAETDGTAAEDRDGGVL